MTTKDEAISTERALKLALVALEETLRTLDDENAKPRGAIADTIWYSEHETLFDFLASKITALREAMTEQKSGIKQVIELYDSPEQPAQQQEPVGRLKSDPDEGHVFVPRIEGDWSMLGKDLYTSPQPSQSRSDVKPWVGLTDEEIADIADGYIVDYRIPAGCSWNFAKDIEAKLLEKNT